MFNGSKHLDLFAYPGHNYLEREDLVHRIIDMRLPCCLDVFHGLCVEFREDVYWMRRELLVQLPELGLEYERMRSLLGSDYYLPTNLDRGICLRDEYRTNAELMDTQVQRLRWQIST